MRWYKKRKYLRRCVQLFGTANTFCCSAFVRNCLCYLVIFLSFGVKHNPTYFKTCPTWLTTSCSALIMNISEAHVPVDEGDSGIPLSSSVSCWKIVSSPTNLDFAFRTNFHFHRTTTLQKNITTINVWKINWLVCTDPTTLEYKDKISNDLSLAAWVLVVPQLRA